MAADIIKMKGSDGKVQYPVTSSEAVGMSDGSGNLDKKFATLDRSIINLNESVENKVYTDNEARLAVPKQRRNQGLILIYKIKDGAGQPSEWRISIYIGGNPNPYDNYWVMDNFWMTIVDSITFDNLKEYISTLDSLIKTKAIVSSNEVINNNMYINWNDGTESNLGAENVYDTTDYIDVSGLEYIQFYFSLCGNLSGAAFYDNTKTYISGLNNKDKGKDYITKVPVNAKYFRTSVRKTDSEIFYVLIGTKALGINSIAQELGESKAKVVSQWLLNKEILKLSFTEKNVYDEYGYVDGVFIVRNEFQGYKKGSLYHLGADYKTTNPIQVSKGDYILVENCVLGSEGAVAALYLDISADDTNCLETYFENGKFEFESNGYIRLSFNKTSNPERKITLYKKMIMRI